MRHSAWQRATLTDYGPLLRLLSQPNPSAGPEPAKEIKMSMFHKAVKEEAKLRLAIIGPSGSGKTYTALVLANHLAQGQPVALVDTEHGSAAKYADLWPFDIAEMHAPYAVAKYLAALKDAEQAGYAVIILDSLSHAWAGPGGVLDVVDEVAKRSKSGSTFAAWREGTPIHQSLIEGILSSGIHVISTMRSKTEYALVKNDRGQDVPKKLGMAPIQRDQMEYEFDIVFDMDQDNNAVVSKSRCPELSGHVIAKPGAETASTILAWLHGSPKAPQSTITVPSTSMPKKAEKPKEAPVAPPEEALEEPFPEGALPLNWRYLPGTYAPLFGKLEGDASAFVKWIKAKHHNTQAGPAEPVKYGILSGLLDNLCGDTPKAHNALLELLCGHVIDHEQPPAEEIVDSLLKWLPKTVKHKGKELTNQAYRPEYVAMIQQLWTVCTQAPLSMEETNHEHAN